MYQKEKNNSRGCPLRVTVKRPNGESRHITNPSIVRVLFFKIMKSQLTLWYQSSLLYDLISSEENSTFAHSATVIANHCSLAFFVFPPGTHHCWVDKGGMILESCPPPIYMANSVT